MNKLGPVSVGGKNPVRIMGILNVSPESFYKKSIRTEKQRIFPSESGELELTIVPSFNRYFYATHKRFYKKSISPIIEKIKEFSSAKIITLDGSFIGNESMIGQVL